MCSDADSPPFNTLSYNLVGDVGLFDFNIDTIRLISSLDYDDGVRHYEIEVFVTDGAFTTSVKGSVNVTPFNDFPPVIRNTGMITNI